MKRYQKFLVFWLVNTVLLYLANMFLPKGVTVGNSILAKYQAFVISGFVWSLVLWNIEKMFKDLEMPTKSTSFMMVSYLAVNFATVWFIARYSFFSGIGIASSWYVLLIAVVANVVQYAAWQYMDKKDRKSIFS